MMAYPIQQQTSSAEQSIYHAEQKPELESLQQALRLAELQHELTLAGTVQMQTLFAGIVKNITRIETANNERGLILTERVRESNSHIDVLEKQIAQNEQLRIEEKRVMDEKISNMQSLINTLVGTVRDLSEKLTQEVSTRTLQVTNLNTAYNEQANRIGTLENYKITQHAEIEQKFTEVNTRHNTHAELIKGQHSSLEQQLIGVNNSIVNANSMTTYVDNRVTAVLNHANAVNDRVTTVENFAYSVNNHANLSNSTLTTANVNTNARIDALTNRFNFHTHYTNGVKPDPV